MRPPSGRRKISNLAIVGALAASVAAAQAQTDLDRITSNLLAFHTGANADPADPNVISALNSIRSSANSALTTMNGDGSWGDIDYASVSSTGDIIVTHYSRIRRMALAHRTPGQSLHGDNRLTSAVERALVYGQGYVYVGCARPGNWWHWEIGLPNELAPALFLAQDYISTTVLQTARDTLNYLIYAAPRMTGQNLIWSATNHMYLALLDDDPARMALVRDAFETQCVIQSGEGIKSDFSFHQHGAQLYNGGYGSGFSDYVSRYLLWADGTSYQVSPGGFETFGRYFLDGSWWMIYRGAYELACRSREITRGNSGTQYVPYSLLVLANVANPRREEAAAAAKFHLTIRSSYDLGRAPLIPAVRQSPVAAADRIGHKHFWKSDFTIHRRANHFISLKMFSDRVKAGENTNNEGLKSWCLSDGVTWMLLDGTDYRSNDVLPTLDWQRLPGTTEERRSRTAGSGLGSGAMRFVGGAWAGGRGVSAMDFDANDSLLRAQKSWFFFDDEMVCLGTSVTCPSNNPVETTINQRRLVTLDAPLIVNGTTQPATMPWTQTLSNVAWANCEGFGYYFPGGATIRAQREIQQGSWRDLNIGGSTAIATNPILTLWFDHGTQPSGQSYAYAVLPNKTAPQMSAYAASPPIVVLAHDPNVHAVRHRGLNAMGAVFWRAGTVDKVTVDKPCVVYTEQSGSTVTLALSEPTHTSATIQVTIRQLLVAAHPPANVRSATSGTTTLVWFGVKDGENTVVEFVAPFSASIPRWMPY